jgi:hypothetical protein
VGFLFFFPTALPLQEYLTSCSHHYVGVNGISPCLKYLIAPELSRLSEPMLVGIVLRR